MDGAGEEMSQRLFTQKSLKKQGRLFPFIYGILLAGYTAFVLLQAFVIPQTYGTGDAAAESTVQETPTLNQSEAVVTDTSYSDENVQITITTDRQYDTSIYVADIYVSDPDYLKTAFAQAVYGKNITESTSQIAQDNNAVLAINGDYYSARSGYVIRNGVLYRSESSDEDQEDLVIYSDGSMDIIREGDITAEELLENGAVQTFCFGPGLVEEGKIAVTENEEVGQAMESNPRTAIGYLGKNHYVMVVTDGRTSESEGLSLYELAAYMQSLGVTEAYNLDGGGSSTMVFRGSVVNQPTTSGRKIKEREVSDIVYIG